MGEKSGDMIMSNDSLYLANSKYTERDITSKLVPFHSRFIFLHLYLWFLPTLNLSPTLTLSPPLFPQGAASVRDPRFGVSFLDAE